MPAGSPRSSRAPRWRRADDRGGAMPPRRLDEPEARAEAVTRGRAAAAETVTTSHRTANAWSSGPAIPGPADSGIRRGSGRHGRCLGQREAAEGAQAGERARPRSARPPCSCAAKPLASPGARREAARAPGNIPLLGARRSRHRGRDSVRRDGRRKAVVCPPPIPRDGWKLLRARGGAELRLALMGGCG